eukprot:CAMPEP_0175416212 /NCGR_PEP_ID=MMETSP0095-20121207/44574_1 /TAXON_ID=311494 /ORGANISM="Alexandrium monilatum, Strain CCMP3105" /LENGTH=135 /DNA_ID=CAMNT_0016715319 /DNA_START=66 /DNA_END=470 /DNA_ORIENTATION=-
MATKGLVVVARSSRCEASKTSIFHGSPACRGNPRSSSCAAVAAAAGAALAHDRPRRQRGPSSGALRRQRLSGIESSSAASGARGGLEVGRGSSSSRKSREQKGSDRYASTRAAASTGRADSPRRQLACPHKPALA